MSYKAMLSAFPALINAGPCGFATHLHDAFRIDIDAMRAKRSMRPPDLFQMLAGLVGILINGVGEFHDPTLSNLFWVRQVYLPCRLGTDLLQLLRMRARGPSRLSTTSNASADFGGKSGGLSELF